MSGPSTCSVPTGATHWGRRTGLPNVLSSGRRGPGRTRRGWSATSVPALGMPIIAPLGRASGRRRSLDVISAAESAGELLDVSEPAEQSPHDSQLDAWDAGNRELPRGFPQVMDSLQFFDQPIVADLTGSRGQAYAVEASSDSDLRAFDAEGREAPGFPKLTGGWVTGGAVFGTLGSMPHQVLVAGTREGELFVWRTGAPASGAQGGVAAGASEPVEHQ